MLENNWDIMRNLSNKSTALMSLLNLYTFNSPMDVVNTISKEQQLSNYNFSYSKTGQGHAIVSST